MTEVTLSDFKAHLEDHLIRASRDREEVVVTRSGDEPMAILPLSELRSLRETLHLLSNASNAARLLGSIAELDAGRGSERPLADH
jgi:antitoxin YefM